MILKIGHTIVPIRSVESTNNYAIKQAADNEIEEGTVFLAHEQTAGRGQAGNGWESEPGMNLTFTILFRPSFLEVYRQFLLSKAVSLALMSFLRQYTAEVKVKWPNDIYVGDRKICGILIENAVMGAVLYQSVAGIGLNINQTRFQSGAPSPVSLKMLTGTTYDTALLIKELLNEIDRFYQLLRRGHSEEIDQEFHRSLYRLGEWHGYRDATHRYTGMITGVNPVGQLRIREKDGQEHEYHFKEVAYL